MTTPGLHLGPDSVDAARADALLQDPASLAIAAANGQPLRWGCKLRKCGDGCYLVVNAAETHFWAPGPDTWLEETGRFRIGRWSRPEQELSDFAACTTPPPDYTAPALAEAIDAAFAGIPSSPEHLTRRTLSSLRHVCYVMHMDAKLLDGVSPGAGTALYAEHLMRLVQRVQELDPTACGKCGGKFERGVCDGCEGVQNG